MFVKRNCCQRVCNKLTQNIKHDLNFIGLIDFAFSKNQADRYMQTQNIMYWIFYAHTQFSSQHQIKVYLLSLLL